MKLDAAGQAAVLDELMGRRFVDRAAHQIHAVLLNEGCYLCVARTMYCCLVAQKAMRERREERLHPAYARPELLAEAPNQLWSWDIDRLKATVRWMYVYLYVALNLYSRSGSYHVAFNITAVFVFIMFLYRLLVREECHLAFERSNRSPTSALTSSPLAS